MAALFLIALFGVALIAGPFVAAFKGYPLGGLTAALLVGSGIATITVSAIVTTIAKLYMRTKASEAFVRTGMGGMRVIKDGGALVVPVVHQLVRISLQTIRLEVNRQGVDALITKDKLRADIRAEFFVRVQPDDASIENAARSFGEQMADQRYVATLVEDKLVSALRQVAATKTLEELNTRRDEFMKEVRNVVTEDLTHNGLTLETATISKLDQTDPKNLRDDNIFDAQGKRTIAEITQRQLTERNRLERGGEQERTQQDVETRKRVLELERQKAEALAAQQAEVSKVQAEKEREAQEKQIEARRAIELANVQKEQAIAVALREQQRAVEVAERKKQEAVALAEKERAAAESQLALAEAERERAKQVIKTVEVEAAAERDKKKRVIEAEALAQQKFVEAQRGADADAYRTQKQAEGRKAAADAEAEAVTKKAEADANAAKLRAEGERAVALVPVQVQQEQVEVERRRVDVLKQELEAREKHGRAAQDFELSKMRIVKEAEVRIEAAKATVNLVGHVQAKVYGTPEDVAKMTQAWMNGMGIAKMVNGFFDGATAETREVSAELAEQLGGVVKGLAQRVSGKGEGEADAAAKATANGPSSIRAAGVQTRGEPPAPPAPKSLPGSRPENPGGTSGSR